MDRRQNCSIRVRLPTGCCAYRPSRTTIEAKFWLDLRRSRLAAPEPAKNGLLFIIISRYFPTAPMDEEEVRDGWFRHTFASAESSCAWNKRRPLPTQSLTTSQTPQLKQPQEVFAGERLTGAAHTSGLLLFRNDGQTHVAFLSSTI